MALTITTDLTNITTAEADTNWSDIGTQSAALEPDFNVQGTYSMSRAVSNNTKGMAYDNGTGIDFTTGTHKDKLVYMWIRMNSPGLMANRSATPPGLAIRLSGTSATANFREWKVSGADVWADNEGWICFVIDPQSAGSNDSGTYDATAVQHFGAVVDTIASAKGQNFGIDRISYGRGELLVSGTVTTAGKGFKEIADWDWDSAKANRWGIINVKDGVIYIKGKIVIGHATANTDFSSENEKLVFQTTTYYNGTNVVKAMPDASVGATTGSDGADTYSGLGFIGGTGTTTIKIGAKVGADRGRSGVIADVPLNEDLTTDGRVLSSITVDDSTMTMSVYGSVFSGFEGTLDLAGTGTAGDDMFSNVFNECGPIDLNFDAMNNTFIGCGQIELFASGRLQGSAISGYEGTANTSALLCNFAAMGADDEVTDMTFTMGTALTHAIELGTNVTSPQDFDSVTLNGYHTTLHNQNDSAIHVKQTTSTFTLNQNSGTSTITYRSDGATVSVVIPAALITITVTARETGLPISGARVYIHDATFTEVMEETTNASGVATLNYTGSTPLAITGWVRVYDLTAPDYKIGEFAGTVEAAGFTRPVQLELET